MKDIHGIEEALNKLRPYLPQLEAHFNEENEKFKKLLQADHDLIGRVLKCHLIIENSLNRYLSEKMDIKALDEIKLTFFQKAQLIPNERESATFVKQGILTLNTVRNKLAHNLSAEVQIKDILPIVAVLHYARPKENFTDPYSAIEAFTAVACAFLIVSPPELQHAVVQAFQSFRPQL